MARSWLAERSATPPRDCHSPSTGLCVTLETVTSTDSDVAIIGLEFLVGDLDGAVAVFVEAFGWQVIERGPSRSVAGTQVVLANASGSGPAITLFAAADHGPGTIVADRQPRLTQVVLGGNTADVAFRLERLGLPTEVEDHAIFVNPRAMAGVWGANAALVVADLPRSPLDPDPDPR